MKNLAITLTVFLFVFHISASGQQDIVIGKIDSLQSEILKENRKLMIHVPNSGSNSIFAKKKYPVLYVLDGDGHFTSIVGLMKQFSGNNLIPEMIVVAIPNTDRTRDLTPSKAKPNPPMVPVGLAEASGGGKNFLAFLEKELVPYIDKTYPTEPYRMIIGHSFGGLFVMDALLDKPELFNSYISIDPSIWWNNSNLLNAYKKSSLKDDKYKNKSLYIGIANTLEKDIDTLAARKMKGPMVDHFNAMFEIRDFIRSKKHDDFYFKSKYYPNDSHGSVPLITAYDGLRFIFDFYRFDIKFDDIVKENTDIVAKMKAHYNNVTKALGYENKPDEAMVNGMGYQLMQMEKMDIAKQFFKMNIEYYPKSSNVYDSYGDYWMALENKAKAIENFEKALAIKENPYSREKLDKLKSN